MGGGPREKTASEFDAGYYGGLLEKAWEEAAFVFKYDPIGDLQLGSKSRPECIVDRS